MRFITAKSATNVADLTRRAFEIKGRKVTERTKQAQAALLQANPHLRDMKKVPAGTLVMVPDLPGVSPVAPPAAPIGPDVVAHLKQAVAGARAVLARAAAAEEQETVTTLDLAKSLAQMSLAKQAPDLQSRLPEIARLTKTRATEAAALNAAQSQALAALDAELDQLSP